MHTAIDQKAERSRIDDATDGLPRSIVTLGVVIFLAVMSFNFLGDHLRDRIDPSSA